ncbi:MAG: alpha/beta hydrolase [Bacteroidetes bacterium]|nr:alpha/beta hydrolase [Bacteroidota bacterium]
MKKLTLIFLFFLNATLAFAQEIYEYEKEITDKNNYTFSELEFKKNDEDISFFGTLIEPKTNYDKIVVIVNGTGPHTRYAHNYLTDSLLKNNIAVFRFDKRGIGKSQGKYNNQPTTYINDLFFILSEFEKKFKNKKIGLIGHSLGGIATIGAIQKGANVDFLVQWATPVGNFGDFIKFQLKTRNSDKELEEQFKTKNIDQIWKLLFLVQSTVQENKDKDYINIYKSVEKRAKEKGYKEKQFRRFLANPDNMDLMKYNFDTAYKNLKIPTLYIIGSKDSFVDAEKSKETIESYKNSNITFIMFDGLNHYLTDSGKITKMTNGLYKIDEKAENKIINWIEKK